MSTDSYRPYPCTQCPWRCDADLRLFSDSDMAKLSRADGSTGAEAALDAPAMACHLDQPGTTHALRLCAGWLAVAGRHHLAIRMAIIAGRLPEQAVVAGEAWPELRTSLDDLQAARAKQMGSPTVSAIRSDGGDDSGHRAVRDLLADRLQLPERPVDGDCLVWTPKVVDVLRSAGGRADEVTVVGWLDCFSTRAIAFVHRAVLLDGELIVDVTARQFAQRLEPIWVAEVDDYCAELEEATGVTAVTVGEHG